MKAYLVPLILLIGCTSSEDTFEKEIPILCQFSLFETHFESGYDGQDLEFDEKIEYSINCEEQNKLILNLTGSEKFYELIIEDGKIISKKKYIFSDSLEFETSYEYINEQLTSVVYNNHLDIIEISIAIEYSQSIPATLSSCVLTDSTNGQSVYNYTYLNGNIEKISGNNTSRPYTSTVAPNTLTINDAILMFDFISPTNIVIPLNKNELVKWEIIQPSKPPNKESFFYQNKEGRLSSFKIEGRFNDGFIINDRTYRYR